MGRNCLGFAFGPTNLKYNAITADPKIRLADLGVHYGRRCAPGPRRDAKIYWESKSGLAPSLGVAVF